MTGIDAGFLYAETPTVHMHTLKVTILEPTASAAEYSFDDAKRQLLQRIHLLPQFRRRILRVPFDLHHPVWIDDPDFDIDNHVHRAEIAAPYGQRQLDQVIGEIASSPLDRRHPLWELWLIDGFEGRYVAGIVKLHHLVADGTAAAHLLANAMNDSAADAPGLGPIPQWSPDAVPSNTRLVRDAMRDHLRQFAHLPVLLTRTLKGAVAAASRRRQMTASPPMPIVDTPKTSINSALTARRKFATTSLSLDEIKRIKNIAGTTVNDVLLACVAASLRRYLQTRNDLPDLPLVAEVPIGTDPRSGPLRLSGNRVSNVFTSLATDVADPAERLHTIHVVTQAGKELEALMGHEMYRDWVEYAPPRLSAWVMRRYSQSKLARKFRPPINVIVSSVHGPAEPLYGAGNALRRIYSVGPILEGVALNVTAWSYLDRLYIAALVCPDVIADPYEITQALGPALEELYAATVGANTGAVGGPESAAERAL